ncbi:MAG: hypothetical protein COB04_09785 [Gammaproteobacteria bacterium]|nr:MAG: hypothetical protein COB04_09785 [Gammaproteobacteria bacterium]
MKYSQAIVQLRDIHIPEPVGLFPLPIGWWILLVAAIVFVGGGYYFTRRYLRRMQRSALKDLTQLERRFNTQREDALTLSAQSKQFDAAIHKGFFTNESGAKVAVAATSITAELSMILKHFAQAQFPKNSAVQFNGEMWLKFLDQTGGENEFRFGVGRNLLVWPYREIEDDSLVELLALSKRWVSQNAYRRWRRVLL